MMIDMRVVLTVCQMLVRVTGVLLLVLGLLIWTENALGLISWHMLLGLVLVIALIVLAGVSVRAGVPVSLAASTIVVGLVLLALGVTQTSILLGSTHWIIQVVHLLLGLSAVMMGEIIGGRLRRLRLAAA
jgi:hypothetical protein